MPFPQTVASPVPDGAMYTTRSFGHLNFIAIHPTTEVRGFSGDILIKPLSQSARQ